ncbi:ATP-binding protein [Micromonospora echinofusca]|uniref:Tetratricopeptide repeat protein n=1 Tax=Micromonospora echinofusca TaxID=47858 RepID=A0ABS3VR87_MICEH|nr:helix-turn-helix domain-containing protein [Micromonospora echinofusca]MBO4207022.1 tetratricopeptide repeat protein [Micromonospora echinofusca]
MSEPTFGSLLRSYRHAAGLTLEQFSEASGVSTRAISDMERGHSRAPQQRTLAALADALGLSPQSRRALVGAANEGRTRGSGGAGTCEPPRAVPDFVGRTVELDRLRRYAADATPDGPAPVAVVHGPPGLGKSTLAVHAASQLRDTFPDGVFFLDLRGIDATPVPPAEGLARLLLALGIGPRRMSADLAERSAQFRAALRERRSIVVLDNAGSEAQVRPLLPGAGSSLLLITSRRALTGLDGVLRLPLSPFSATESAELLVGMVGRNSDRVTPPALAEVAGLCENLPLALRLAGNRLVSRPGWTMAHLAARLSDADRRLATLTAGDLGVEAAFGLSYAQLTDSARQTFRRLSLVPGEDFAAPLAAVLAQCSVSAVEDHLDELADLGLLQADRGDRFRFHDLIRLFARNRLRNEEPDSYQRAARDRMVRWLLETVVAAGRWFDTGGDVEPVGGPAAVDLNSIEAADEWLQVERANWLAALRIAASGGEHRLVVEVAEAMHWYSDRTTHWGVWPEVYARSQEAAAQLGDERLLAVHLNYLSWALSYCEQRHEESVTAAAEAFEVAVRVGDRSQQAWALEYMARARRALGDFQGALDTAREAVPLFDAATDHEGYVQAFIGIGHTLFELGRFAEAADSHQIALQAAEERPLRPTVALFSRAQTRLQIGKCLAVQERWAEAERYLLQAMPLLEEFGAPIILGQGHYWLGQTKHALEAPDEARSHLARAVEQYQAADSESLAQRAREALAELDRADDLPAR